MLKPLRILIPLVVFLLILCGFAFLGQFAGGELFGKMQKLPPDTVGVFTLYDYWHAYGDVPAVARALKVCTLLSVVITALPAVVITMALVLGRKRLAQFGEARFATRSDIVKAGLLEKKQP
jgi:type IV secretory pathway TraG/TraD family ATPase VirD4